MRTWRSKVPWMMEGEPWSFVILMPILAVFVLCGALLLGGPIYWMGRLLGAEKDWVWK